MLQIFFIERETFFTLCAQYVRQTFMSEVGCYQPADKYIIKKMNIIETIIYQSTWYNLNLLLNLLKTLYHHLGVGIGIFRHL